VCERANTSPKGVIPFRLLKFGHGDWDDSHYATRIRWRTQRRGSGVAACGSGAARRARAAHRCAPAGRQKRSRVEAPPLCVHASACGLGLDRWRNVQMDLRWYGDDINRIRALAQELVGLQPDIIVTGNTTPRTVAVQQETRTIQIVFANAIDPVASGLVGRLDRPSRNITGFASKEASLGGKWLELLSEIAPALKRAAIMFNPDTAAVSPYMPSVETATRSPKVVPITAPVRSDIEIETAIVALGREPGGGLVAMSDSSMVTHRASIISAAARNNAPAVYIQSFFVRDGGLLSYGVDAVDQWRRAASHADRILRGEKPGDLPVQFRPSSRWL
jgi:putative tryptophan/tyrosine transport system substrate-binding protein